MGLIEKARKLGVGFKDRLSLEVCELILESRIERIAREYWEGGSYTKFLQNLEHGVTRSQVWIDPREFKRRVYDKSDEIAALISPPRNH